MIANTHAVCRPSPGSLHNGAAAQDAVSDFVRQQNRDCNVTVQTYVFFVHYLQPVFFTGAAATVATAGGGLGGGLKETAGARAGAGAGAGTATGAGAGAAWGTAVPMPVPGAEGWW
jgi:hypothetical protein